MAKAIDEALAVAGDSPNGVDKVFLTGGTSFVPAVRRLFTDRFGEAKIESGGELVSIATYRDDGGGAGRGGVDPARVRLGQGAQSRRRLRQRIPQPASDENTLT